MLTYPPNTTVFFTGQAPLSHRPIPLATAEVKRCYGTNGVFPTPWGAYVPPKESKQHAYKFSTKFIDAQTKCPKPTSITVASGNHPSHPSADPSGPLPPRRPASSDPPSVISFLYRRLDLLRGIPAHLETRVDIDYLIRKCLSGSQHLYHGWSEFSRNNITACMSSVGAYYPVVRVNTSSGNQVYDFSRCPLLDGFLPLMSLHGDGSRCFPSIKDAVIGGLLFMLFLSHCPSSSCSESISLKPFEYAMKHSKKLGRCLCLSHLETACITTKLPNAPCLLISNDLITGNWYILPYFRAKQDVAEVFPRRWLVADRRGLLISQWIQPKSGY